MKCLTVIGTRPEAIKLAPVVWELDRRPRVESLVCLTAQHRDMLDQMIPVLGLRADYDLNLMQPGQTLEKLSAAALVEVGAVIRACSPDVVLVQGDTCTAFVAGLAAFYNGIPVAHVEAGLRTGNMRHPWPEEGNRRLLGQISTIHFAPTPRAAANLIAEGIPAAAIEVCGNTVVDTLRYMRQRLETDADMRAQAQLALPPLPAGRRRILVTMHRRENFGGPVAAICKAIIRLASIKNVEIVLPVHPNPSVQGPIRDALGENPNIHLVPPLDYPSFVLAMLSCEILISDSGGVQEEAPTFGKPVLVLRETTERMEAVEAGFSQLVGSDEEAIVGQAIALLNRSKDLTEKWQSHNPFGDGMAALRIVDRLQREYDGNWSADSAARSAAN